MKKTCPQISRINTDSKSQSCPNHLTLWTTVFLLFAVFACTASAQVYHYTVTNAAGAPLVRFLDDGAVQMPGGGIKVPNATPAQLTPNEAVPEFIIRNTTEVIARIDGISGNFYLKGGASTANTLVENPAAHEFIIRNEQGNAVFIIDQNGNAVRYRNPLCATGQHKVTIEVIGLGTVTPIGDQCVADGALINVIATEQLPMRFDRITVVDAAGERNSYFPRQAFAITSDSVITVHFVALDFAADFAAWAQFMGYDTGSIETIDNNSFNTSTNEIIGNGIPDLAELALFYMVLTTPSHPIYNSVVDAWYRNRATQFATLKTKTAAYTGIPLNGGIMGAMSLLTLQGLFSAYATDIALRTRLLEFDFPINLNLFNPSFSYPDSYVLGLSFAWNADFDGDGFTNKQEWKWSAIGVGDMNTLKTPLYVQTASSDGLKPSPTQAPPTGEEATCLNCVGKVYLILQSEENITLTREDGSVETGDFISIPVYLGEKVRVSAPQFPNENRKFWRWGTVPPSLIDGSFEFTEEFVVTSRMSITANFENRRPIVVGHDARGSINITPNSDHVRIDGQTTNNGWTTHRVSGFWGDTLALSAIPDGGYHFHDWSFGLTGHVYGQYARTLSTSITLTLGTLPLSGLSQAGAIPGVAANFFSTPRNVGETKNFSVSNTAGGQALLAFSYSNTISPPVFQSPILSPKFGPSPILVWARPIAEKGHQFSHWSFDGQITYFSYFDLYSTQIANLDTSVQAVFRKMPTLTLTTSGTGSLSSPACGGYVQVSNAKKYYGYAPSLYGGTPQQVTLTAVLKPNCTFSGWTGNTGISTNPLTPLTTNPITVTMDVARAINAEFYRDSGLLQEKWTLDDTTTDGGSKAEINYTNRNCPCLEDEEIRLKQYVKTIFSYPLANLLQPCKNNWHLDLYNPYPWYINQRVNSASEAVMEDDPSVPYGGQQWFKVEAWCANSVTKFPRKIISEYLWSTTSTVVNVVTGKVSVVLHDGYWEPEPPLDIPSLICPSE